MIIATTYEQFKNLPKNKNRDSKVVYNEWLLEESKLLLMYQNITMFNMESMESNGPAGGSTPPSGLPPTSSRITYFTPNGADGVTFGYFTPDLDDGSQSYYVYV